jgi:hypothetical protein
MREMEMSFPSFGIQYITPSSPSIDGILEFVVPRAPDFIEEFYITSPNFKYIEFCINARDSFKISRDEYLVFNCGLGNRIPAFIKDGAVSSYPIFLTPYNRLTIRVKLESKSDDLKIVIRQKYISIDERDDMQKGTHFIYHGNTKFIISEGTIRLSDEEEKEDGGEEE